MEWWDSFERLSEQRQRWIHLISVICLGAYLVIAVPMINCSITSPASTPFPDPDSFAGKMTVPCTIALEVLVMFLFCGFRLSKFVSFWSFVIMLAFLFVGIFAFLTPYVDYCEYHLAPSFAIRAALRNPDLTSSGADTLGEDYDDDDDTEYPDTIPDISANLLGRVSEAQKRHKRRPLYGLVRIPRGIVLTAFNDSASFSEDRARREVTVAPLVDLSQILKSNSTTTNSTNASENVGRSKEGRSWTSAKWAGLTPVEASARWNRSQPIGVWAIASTKGALTIGRTTDSWFDEKSTFAFMRVTNARESIRDAINEAAERYGLVTKSEYVAIVEWDTEASFRNSKQKRLTWLLLALTALVVVWTIALWHALWAIWKGYRESRNETEQLLRFSNASGIHRNYNSMWKS